MPYRFQELKLSNSEQLWLKKILEKKFQKIRIRDLKIELRTELSKEFDPEQLDFRLISGGARIKLIGIWYVDPKYYLFEVIDKVINFIKSNISVYKDCDKLDANDLATKINLSKRDIAVAFLLLNDIGYLNGGIWLDGIHGFEYASFSNTEKAFDKFIYYEKIEHDMEEYYLSNALNAKKNNINDRLHRPSFNLEQDYFINPERIDELRTLNNQSYDFIKLIRLCEELNNAHTTKSYYSIILISRMILEHIPPVFGFKRFIEVANNYGGGSFKKSMEYLFYSCREIANINLHTKIRETEVLPNFNQVNFSNQFDVLLAEIIRKSK